MRDLKSSFARFITVVPAGLAALAVMGSMTVGAAGPKIDAKQKADVRGHLVVAQKLLVGPKKAHAQAPVKHAQVKKSLKDTVARMKHH